MQLCANCQESLKSAKKHLSTRRTQSFRINMKSVPSTDLTVGTSVFISEHRNQNNLTCCRTASLMTKWTERGGDIGPEYLMNHPRKKSVLDWQARWNASLCVMPNESTKRCSDCRFYHQEHFLYYIAAQDVKYVWNMTINSYTPVSWRKSLVRKIYVCYVSNDNTSD